MSNKDISQDSHVLQEAIDLLAMAGEHDDQVGMGNVVAGHGKTIEVDSPYYLHPSDHPGLVFVPHPLIENGESYFTWRRNIMTALESKNKVRFINNSVTRSEPQLPRLSAMGEMQRHSSILAYKFSSQGDPKQCSPC
ncbi:hypothetical protein RJ639_028927 [Escallonia herrerae]|uniref:Retrotransposon Copia-like N-terminal domain-containing protein n=1 Tax=Escallonia herrerae TaxID=1293975 RepID=A0AA89BFC5_9ASTE|nr:hypothetical protein RJ639_028927 [Escallonia herrerae]